ncbi:MAG TPA: hypothetical protein DCE41_04110 [Cytophagales bacterium]|nr:hypothetical protein [Cytophagales bacterium]HAA22273.1 hypothetical protein [Cytophagales bacterium]HAP59335.1 hypothetical protein [Cytophagales bacterium]
MHNAYRSGIQQALVTLSLIVIGLYPRFVQAQTFGGNSWSETKANGQGTLAVVSYEIPGMIETGTDGQPTGVCVEVLNDFVEYVNTNHGVKLRIDYQHREGDFSRFMAQTRKGDHVLGLTTMSIMKSRQGRMQLTPAYMRNQLVLMTHNSVPFISSFTDLSRSLKGKTALAVADGNNEEYLRLLQANYYPEMKIEFRASEKEILKDMAASSEYFSILDFTAYYQVIKKRLPLRRQDVPLERHFQESFGFLLSDNSDWNPLWEEFLTSSYRTSTGYRKAVSDNLGSAFMSFARP